MKLRQLFYETNNEPESELSPGERQTIPTREIEELTKLNQKIHKVSQAIYSQQGMYVPKEQRENLEQIKKATQEKLDYLNNKKTDVESRAFVGNLPRGLHDLLKKIETECSDIVEEYINNRGKFLYRGIKQDVDAFRGRPYDSRKALDSDKMLSDALNSALKQAGFGATRDNSIFTSSRRSQASNYGTTYIIFPRNGFDISWSTSIRDFVFDYYKFREYFVNTVKKQDPEYPEFIQALRKISDLTDYFGHLYSASADDVINALYANTRDLESLEKLINDGKLDQRYQKFAEIDYFITPERAVQVLNMKNDDLSGAIQSGHEVTIRGNYYAINSRDEDKVMAFFKDKFPPDPIDDFKESQAVEVTKGPHKGTQGLVTYISKTYRTVEIRTTLGKSLEIDPDELKIIDVNQLFPVGSFVKADNGFKGEVVSIDDQSNTASVKSTKDQKVQDVKISTLIAIDRETAYSKEYELDDAVIVKNTGKLGKISYKYLSSDEVELFDVYNMYMGTFKNQDIEHATPEQVKKAIAEIPKVGDTVEVLAGMYKGKIIKIEKINSYNEIIFTDENSGFQKAVDIKNVKKVRATPTVKKPDNNPNTSNIDKTKLKDLFDKGKQQGYVTDADLNSVLPPDQVTSEQIEDVLNMLSEMGIQVVEDPDDDDINKVMSL